MGKNAFYVLFVVGMVSAPLFSDDSQKSGIWSTFAEKTASFSWGQVKSGFLNFLHYTILFYPLHNLEKTMDDFKKLSTSGELGVMPVDESIAKSIRMIAKEAGNVDADSMLLLEMDIQYALTVFKDELIVNPPSSKVVYVNTYLFSTLSPRVIATKLLENFSVRLGLVEVRSLSVMILATLSVVSMGYAIKKGCNTIKAACEGYGAIQRLAEFFGSVATFCGTLHVATYSMNDFLVKQYRRYVFKNFVKNFENRELLKAGYQEIYEMSGDVEALEKLQILESVEAYEAAV